jgi:hypothetical protein
MEMNTANRLVMTDASTGGINVTCGQCVCSLITFGTRMTSVGTETTNILPCSVRTHVVLLSSPIHLHKYLVS